VITEALSLFGFEHYPLIVGILVGIASMRVIGDGSGYMTYLTNAPEHYYTLGSEEGGEATLDSEKVGEWLGPGAKRLGIEHQPIVRGDGIAKALFHGVHPFTGEVLRHGAHTAVAFQDPRSGETKTRQSRAGFDIVLSGDKSIDALFALGPVWARRKIILAYERATEEIVSYLNREIGYTRTGSAGKGPKEKMDPIYGRFFHFTNRLSEPKVHVHLFTFNVGFREDGSGGTLDSDRILKGNFKFGVGQRFRDALVRHVNLQFKEYGLIFDPYRIKNGTAYRVRGVPQALCDDFSQRHFDIQKRIEGKDLTSRQRHAEVLKSRPKKQQSINLPYLHREWAKVGQKHDFDAQAFLEESHRQHQTRINYEVLVAMIQNQASADPEWGAQFAASEAESPAEVRAAQDVRKLVRLGDNSFAQDEPQSKTSEREYFAGRGDSGAVEAARKLKTKWWLPKSWQHRSPDEEITTLRDQIARQIEKSPKRESWFRVKLVGLYLTGAISYKSYRTYMHGKGLPRTLLGIEWQYWTGQIKLSQRIALRVSEGHEAPTFGIPKSRLAINFARAINQITETQRLVMLKKLAQRKELRRKESVARIRRRLEQSRSNTRERGHER
jgi:conjugative relaxase-like TrwC/TraI family protein